MKNLKKQLGFHVIELILFVVIFSLVGLLGYTFYTNSQMAKSNTSEVQQSSLSDEVTAAPEIVTASDLTKAEKVLDSADLEGTTDSAQLNSQLSGF